MSRKQPKRRAGRLASLVIAGVFIFVVACGVGFGVASADSSDDLAQFGAFGFDAATHEATLSQATAQPNAARADVGTSGQQVLASTSSRDITVGLEMVEEREVAEQARVEADNKAAIERVASKKAMQGVEDTASTVKPAAASEAKSASTSGSASSSEKKASKKDEIDEYDLSAVDWSVGKKAFIEEWGARIDAYLEGTNLAGYGEVFAEASWATGVDPRWSPAISNTESGNGAHCFLPYNAWGWGSNSWPDWETAIREHVAGLAEGYGYSVTYAAAQKYCPPNSVHWYNNTLSQMALI